MSTLRAYNSRSMASRALFLLTLTTLAWADTSPRTENIDPTRFTLLRSFAAPHASILSPAGQFLLAYNGNNSTLVDLRAGREAGELAGHTANIHDGHFSLDGKLVATAGYDGTVRIWDTAARKELRSIAGHAGYA